MKKTHKANDLIQTGQAAEILGKSKRTVRRWVHDGKIASIRVGKNDLVSKRAVVRLKQKLESDK